MKRDGLCICTKTTLLQKIPTEYEFKIVEFLRFAISPLRKYNLEINQITNMDDVPVTIDVLSHQSVDSKDTKSIVMGTTKISWEAVKVIKNMRIS